jgi:hypothetical protein
MYSDKNFLKNKDQFVSDFPQISTIKSKFKTLNLFTLKDFHKFLLFCEFGFWIFLSLYFKNDLNL